MTRSKTRNPRLALVSLLCGLLILSACGNLRDQPKYHNPYDASLAFEGQSAARNILPEAVPIGFSRQDELLSFGTVDGQYTEFYPFEITEEILMEGRRWYEGMCSACHGYSGYGDGVTSAEGYPQPGPRSFHDPELADVSPGFIVSVIKYGSESGLMYDYAARVPEEQRWAVAAYIKTLQRSQFVPLGSAAASDETATDEGETTEATTEDDSGSEESAEAEPATTEEAGD